MKHYQTPLVMSIGARVFYFGKYDNGYMINNKQQEILIMNNHVIDELTAFFETYKKLEKKKWVKIKDWSSRDETYELILRTQQIYLETKVNTLV